jgi:phage terminase large subunit-like protein
VTTLEVPRHVLLERLDKLKELRQLLFEKEVREGRAHRPRKWVPLPHQVPPEGNWYGWLLQAGRGAGKTDACAKYVVDHVNGPPCLEGDHPHWIGIIGPTQGDAVTSCVEGPSGIRAHDPSAKLVVAPGGTVVRWPNGSEAKLFGASTKDEADRLRSGGNRCLAWLEELAAWRYLDDCWDHMRFGLRSGPRPHFVASTTPRPKPLLRKLNDGKIRRVVITKGTTYDNPHLSEEFKEALEDAYGGLTLGDQELLGLLIEADDNALWTPEGINRNRVSEAPDLSRIEVGVDPSGGRGEQGIVVVGKHELIVTGDKGRKKVQHGYVLADMSCRLSPAGWGERAVRAALDYDADCVVVETNYGGDMAVSVIQGAVDDAGINLPVRTVTASRGKKVRAEPVAALTTRDRWHHVGRFEELELQLTTWTADSDESPDRLDAMVWPAWHMKLVGVGSTNTVGTFGGGSVSRTRF